jgi:hypothetical protein
VLQRARDARLRHDGPSACGRIINLGETTDVAFYMHVGDRRYRVHVFRTIPDMVFSFEPF